MDLCLLLLWHSNFYNLQLFAYAILGFALTEAIALFGLMMAFLILFGF
jgi:F0F1-type ATP synthase membrane subunit c/vacuolar-type H+-ATPase subunit K